MDSRTYKDGAPGPWYTAYAKCDVCAYVWVAVYPHGTNTDALECPNCQAMSSEVSADLPPEFE